MFENASRKNYSEEEVKMQEELADLLHEAVAAAPLGWEKEIDNELLQERRTEILNNWSDANMRSHLATPELLYRDPTEAKAVIDVVRSKITRAR